MTISGIMHARHEETYTPKERERGDWEKREGDVSAKAKPSSLHSNGRLTVDVKSMGFLGMMLVHSMRQIDTRGIAKGSYFLLSYGKRAL